jgi:hypothetical protein
VDESATGSVNFFGPTRNAADPLALVPPLPLGSRAMHLRPPSIDHGITSFLWALFFGLFIWIGGQAVGFGGAVTFIAGCVGGFLIFLFVRVYGEDEPRRPV